MLYFGRVVFHPALAEHLSMVVLADNKVRQVFDTLIFHRVRREIDFLLLL